MKREGVKEGGAKRILRLSLGSKKIIGKREGGEMSNIGRLRRGKEKGEGARIKLTDQTMRSGGRRCENIRCQERINYRGNIKIILNQFS